MNPAPNGMVYMKVVTDRGAVVTNGTLEVTQARSFGTVNCRISMNDVDGTGYIQLAPGNFGRPGGNFIASGYCNVTLWAGFIDNPNVTNNPPPWYWATIPSIQVQPDSTVYVAISAPSGVVTVVTANEGNSTVTTKTTSATTIKNGG